MKKIGLIGIIAGLLVIGGLSLAAESSDVEGWEPVSAGPVNGWIAPVSGKGEFYIQSFWFVNSTRGFYDSSGNYTALPDDDKTTARQLYLYMQYGVTDKLSLSGQLLYVKNFVRQTGLEADSAGFGDSNLYALYCLQEEKINKPCVTLLAQLKIPMGRFENANPDSLGTDMLGTGSYDPGVGIILTKKFQPLMLHANLICTVPLKTTVDQVSTKYGAYWNYDAGLEIFISHGFNILLEGNGFAQGKTKTDGASSDDTNSSYIVFGPGIGWSNDQIQTLIALQTTTSGKNTDAINSWVFTVIYSF